jgi:hypothetical protein
MSCPIPEGVAYLILIDTLEVATTTFLQLYRISRLAVIANEVNRPSSLPSNRQRTAGCSFFATLSTYSSDFHFSSQIKTVSLFYLNGFFSETNHRR